MIQSCSSIVRSEVDVVRHRICILFAACWEDAEFAGLAHLMSPDRLNDVRSKRGSETNNDDHALVAIGC